MAILQSVGKGGFNRRQDVLHVQRLLNMARKKSGRMPIKVDGIAGPQTDGAISEFQKDILPLPDGRVDPAGRTIKALEAQIGALQQELEIYGTLAMALSYSPEFETPLLSDRYLVSMLRNRPGRKG